MYASKQENNEKNNNDEVEIKPVMFDNRGRFITVEEKKKVIDKMTIPEIAHEIKVFNKSFYVYIATWRSSNYQIFSFTRISWIK